MHFMVIISSFVRGISSTREPNPLSQVPICKPDSTVMVLKLYKIVNLAPCVVWIELF